MALRTGERILHQIVSTVASSLELDEVLKAVVRLMSDGSGVHACFVYLVDEGGDRLVLRAASAPYERQAGKVTLARGEGLAWWAAEHGEAAFIRDDALADPRTKYVPELEEERFLSLLALPIVGRSGDAIGAITAHTEAPREFSDDEVDFLVSSASLVGSAIENARLYEETRLRVAELEQLTELAEAIARVDALDELVDTVVERALPLLAARACHVYLLDPGSEELERRASAPDPGSARARLGLAELGPELARGGRSTRVAVPLVANGELIGLLVGDGSTRVELGRAIASQVAVGIERVQVIEQLTEKNLIKDFFEDACRRESRAATSRGAPRASAATSTLPHVVLVAEPPDDALERAVRSTAPGSIFDRREDSLRALVKFGTTSPATLLERLREDPGRARAGPSLSASRASARARRRSPTGSPRRSRPCSGRSCFERSPRCSRTRISARTSTSSASRSTAASGTQPWMRSRASPSTTRSADPQLVTTLEEFLRRHGNISATSEALFVHPNTLRQRLRRVAELSGLDLRRDDWLMIEIAVKMVRLEQALGAEKRQS